MTRRAANSQNLRARLAQEAARLMIEHGIADFRLAKHKAASRLGVSLRGVLPSNAEIEERLNERLRIFDPEGHESQLMDYRRVAAEMMSLFADFQPRLVGAVLNGSVTQTTPVELHLFTDTSENVAMVLGNHQIPFRDCQRRYRVNVKETLVCPGYTFRASDIRVDAMTFPEKALRQAPLSPVSGRPMRRAGEREVLKLLGEAAC